MPKTIEIGGGGPAWNSTGIIVPTDGRPHRERPEKDSSRAVVRLGDFDEAKQRGQDLYALVLKEIKRAREGAWEKGIRELTRLAQQFPRFVHRIPEFHVFMNDLVKQQKHDAVRSILGGVRRGRRYSTPFYILGLMKAVRAQVEGCSSVVKAAEFIARHHGDNRLVAKSAQSIVRDYESHHRIFEIFQGERFIPGELLTPRPWTPED